MLFYADLHVHSRFSRATSKSLDLEQMALWGAKKGLSVISVGDFTHPKWFEEIKENLIESDDGTFRLKPDIAKRVFKNGQEVKFILSVEVSTIYKKGDKTRKVHHVVFAPNLKTAQNFRNKLSAIGNINSDGRPILGLDSRNLLEITLESGEGAYIIPAHIWTPWFSVLGSKSGFDSIEECYEDLSDHIFALETGLSSDPEMNWHVSKLDRFRLVSNSDAHSASKLAREATVFDHNPNYYSIMNALKTGDGYVGTVEFFPQEGKYHEDGHRKCKVHFTPEETKELSGICPVCSKPLTIGVSYRVHELSDRKELTTLPKTAGKVFSLVPLEEIICEILKVGPSSKAVGVEYERLINIFGSELAILQDVPKEELSKTSPLLAEGIDRLRSGKVIKQSGYDGEYGKIKLFEEDELKEKKYVNLKFDLGLPEVTSSKKEQKKNITPRTLPFKVTEQKEENKTCVFDEFQKEAMETKAKQALIVAGPGSGKTTVLVNRIIYQISNFDIQAQNILAITFTKKAAIQMKERLDKILGKEAENINIHTFHSLALSILKENYQKASLDEDFIVLSEQERALIKDEKILNKALGFDDLITLCVKLLEENEDTLLKYQEKFSHMFVDEYQDIDENQYRLIRLLVNSEGNIFVIGDSNQAIYGFRGGSSKYFDNFRQDYPNALKITLKNNYRSTNNIVDASCQMIESYNIASKWDKPHEKITIHQAKTDKAEAEYIVSTIENLIGGHSFFSIDSQRATGEGLDYSFSDFAILYRTSSQADILTEALNRAGMPYFKSSNDFLCEQKEIKELLGKLTDEKSQEEQMEELSIVYKDKIEDYILKYLKNLSKGKTSKIDFLREVSLVRVSDTLYSPSDRITLMTLHASKGLEFKCVFIVGLEEGIIPLYRAKEKEEIQEEKRLLYVGMTRAKERLYLIHAQKRKWLGKMQNLAISPFLAKIKEDLFKLTTFNKEFRQKTNAEQLSLF